MPATMYLSLNGSDGDFSCCPPRRWQHAAAIGDVCAGVPPPMACGLPRTVVRKRVLWKINIDVTGEYPAYFVHRTDYSSTRRAPPSWEVRLASAEEEATAIAERMIESSVRKGWERVM
jgi:hypothetical protein